MSLYICWYKAIAAVLQAVETQGCTSGQSVGINRSAQDTALKVMCRGNDAHSQHLWMQFVREFAKLGLTRSVGGVLGLALARELTPVVTSIILAGAPVGYAEPMASNVIFSRAISSAALQRHPGWIVCDLQLGWIEKSKLDECLHSLSSSP